MSERTAPIETVTPAQARERQDAGATLAVPAQGRQAVVGGDFRLDSLGQMLARVSEPNNYKVEAGSI